MGGGNSFLEMGQDVHLVWLKRDLRLRDHPCLHEVGKRCAAGDRMLAVYVYEPLVYEASEFDVCHLYFINECLAELREGLRKLGGELLVVRGDIIPVITQLTLDHSVTHLWAHEETGNMTTFARDLQVAEWARQTGVSFIELPQNGVVRRPVSYTHLTLPTTPYV